MEKLVSVIIPAYNHEKYIKDCIESVINQTYKNLEIIVEDDCSKDNTAKVIRNINDKRLKKIFSKKNKGVVDTMNDLVSRCTGDYIAILGSDDVWYPTKIEKQVKVMEENPKLGAVFTLADIIDEKGNINEEEFSSNIFKKDNMTQAERIRMFYEIGNHLCHPSSLIPKKVMQEIGEYNKAYRQLHDYDYWTRLVGKYNIYVITEKLMGYRHEVKNKKNVSSISETNIIRHINETFNINYQMIINMDCELFKMVFSDLLIRKNIETTEEMLCEKYFILSKMKVWGVTNKQLAFNLIFNYENKNKLFEILQKKYNYNINDFYNDTGMISEIIPMEFIPRYKDLVRELSRLNKEINQILKERDKILNSKSWKITKPLRKIVNSVKGK